MKILNLRDTHFRGKNSVHRIGNMYEDMLLKFDEVIELSKQCDIIIHDGDVWDSPEVSNLIIDDFIDRIEKSKKHWYINIGNHDMKGANWKASQSSALAHTFRRSKYIHLLTDLEFEDCYIKGYPYYYACEEDIKNQGLYHNKKNKYTIASTHSFISIKSFHPQVLHVQAKDIETNYDLILCSHFHNVFDEIINNTRFVNSGELCRLSITEATHKPQVIIIDTKSKEIKTVFLQSAKPPEEIFNISKIQEAKEFNADIDKFIKSIEDTQFQEMSIQDTVNYIAKEKKIDPEVVQLIMEKINE